MDIVIQLKHRWSISVIWGITSARFQPGGGV